MSSSAPIRRARDAAASYPGAQALLTAGVRLSLLVAALGIFALGFFQLPETAATRGELVIGEVLAIAVGIQMLLAAFFCPAPSRTSP